MVLYQKALLLVYLIINQTNKKGNYGNYNH